MKVATGYSYTCALVGVFLLALLHNAGSTAGACVASATRVPGCSTCKRVGRATVCIGCKPGYVFKRVGTPAGSGRCGELVGLTLPIAMSLTSLYCIANRLSPHRVCCWLWQRCGRARAKQQARPKLQAVVRQAEGLQQALHRHSLLAVPR
jgi:hypothetical protein